MKGIQPAALIIAGAVIAAGITTVVVGYRAAVSADGHIRDDGARQPIERQAGTRPNQSADATKASVDWAEKLKKWKEAGMETATFAAGCFWGIEAAFRRLDGVVETEVGYTGGHVPDPGYKRVCRGDTGHAEAVRVVYDPERIGFDDLLRTFWQIHDPTQLNRQGPDVGEQYRSAIFYHNDPQREAAEQSKQRVNSSNKYRGRVVTQIVPAEEFYRAEEYHQQYLEKRGQAACPTGH
jgi:peptide-methionine (S)-S-oxide reductase